GFTRRTVERRRPLRRGSGSGHRRVPRQFPAGARAPRADRRRGGHRQGVARMTVSWLAAGFLATLVLTTMARAAGEMGLTRMDLPFLLGTTVTENRRKAKAIGYVFHFIIGIAFAALYVAFFAVIGRS